MKKMMRQVIEICKPFGFAMLGVFGFIAASQALGLLAPFLQGRVIDAITQKRALRETYILVGLAFTATFTRVVILSYLRERYELKNMDFRIIQHATQVTLRRLLNFSIGQHVSENSGLKYSVITRGQSALGQMVNSGLYQILPLAIEVILLVVALLYFSLPLGLLLFSGVSIYVGLTVYINRKFQKDMKKIEKMYNTTSSFQKEILGNMALVLANAQEERTLNESDSKQSELFDYARSIWLRYNDWGISKGTIITLTNTAAMGLGIYFVYRGKYSLGQLVMFTSWSNNAMGRIGEIGNLHRQMTQNYNSVEKYFDMLDIEPDVKVIQNPVQPLKFTGQIEFRNVTLSYKGRNETDDKDEETPTDRKASPALRNVSFTIDAGQKVAFVGESGAGKSTILYTLLRSQDPEQGQVVVDGNDLRILDLKHFRERIGIVDQSVPLFDNTLRYNITYSSRAGVAELTNLELDQISEMSCINRFFDRLEQGYETMIGERGIKLSGGERQRVGIARALAKNPDILIFDEATSNLDSENESLIRESIEKAACGRTTIIIAHRFSTIKAVDKIFVFNRGEIVGEGSHAELMLNCDHYRRLVQSQVF
jgi:ATP-binding cassette subfamily B protein